jgi:hypothetical protein
LEPSTPYKLNKKLLKCRILGIHVPDDIISDEGIRNFKRASKPFIVLSNLFSYKVDAKLWVGLQRRIGNVYTKNQSKNDYNISFWMSWTKDEPLFDFPEFKTTILSPICPWFTDQQEEDEYYFICQSLCKKQERNHTKFSQ